MKSNVEQAIEAIAELLTATHDHGSWKPGIVISYLGPNFDNGEGWYIALNEYRHWHNKSSGVYSVDPSDLTPTRTTIFKGKYETLREALKAAADEARRDEGPRTGAGREAVVGQTEEEQPPMKKPNGKDCLLIEGPCSCGAWHDKSEVPADGGETFRKWRGNVFTTDPPNTPPPPSALL